jgi:hypothetical protein
MNQTIQNGGCGLLIVNEEGELLIMQEDEELLYIMVKSGL